MPDRHTSNDPPPEPTPEPTAGEPSATPAEPLNRAERRAQRRGRKPVPPPTGKGPHVGHRDQVVVPRRSGRRGNR
ncbi:MAG: hypothetical protein GEV12_03940 [Micromonosporaceae bacterium]|nr:hypothetical protein [Micromonosporaceae bacterium]